MIESQKDSIVSFFDANYCILHANFRCARTTRFITG